MALSHRSEAKNLWKILFQCSGSIWCAVLPFCALNCTIMLILEVLAYYDFKIAFSPAGHGLMALLVTFLVVSKVSLCLERYMSARSSIGNALTTLRELNQSTLLFTRKSEDSAQWRAEGTSKIFDLMDCTIRVLQNHKQATYLARNDPPSSPNTADDPMQYVQALRFHLYSVDDDLQLLERMKLLDILNAYVVFYTNLLKLASTPLPFPLIQMGRTFLFLWTFTLPFVLRGVVNEIWSALIFVFFLTYGFVGLELVSLKMLSPFGDGENDLNVTGMKEATIIGIEHDLKLFGEATSLREKRLQYSRQKPRMPVVPSDIDDGRPILDADEEQGPSHENINYMYHVMG